MPAPITGLSSMATRQVLADLAAAYEARTGRAVAVRPMGGVVAARRVRAGAAADVIVLAAPVMAELEAEGHVAPGSRAAFARSGIALAVPEGAARPEIGDAQAVRAAMLGASRIGYSTGPSGDHLKRLVAAWGLAERLRLVQAPAGVPVAALLARGESDLGFQQLSELQGAPGIAVLGLLPEPIQAVTVFAAGIGAAASDPEAARALIAFLASSDAAAAKRRYGLEPP
jgi:molybdate transport system substrate-binding protein